MAVFSLASAASFPTTYNSSFTGSETVPPVSAIRIGWKIFPAATPCRSASARNVRSSASGVQSAALRTGRLASSDAL